MNILKNINSNQKIVIGIILNSDIRLIKENLASLFVDPNTLNIKKSVDKYVELIKKISNLLPQDTINSDKIIFNILLLLIKSYNNPSHVHKLNFNDIFISSYHQHSEKLILFKINFNDDIILFEIKIEDENLIQLITILIENVNSFCMNFNNTDLFNNFVNSEIVSQKISAHIVYEFIKKEYDFETIEEYINKLLEVGFTRCEKKKRKKEIEIVLIQNDFENISDEIIEIYNEFTNLIKKYDETIMINLIGTRQNTSKWININVFLKKYNSDFIHFFESSQFSSSIEKIYSQVLFCKKQIKNAHNRTEYIKLIKEIEKKIPLLNDKIIKKVKKMKLIHFFQFSRLYMKKIFDSIIEKIPFDFEDRLKLNEKNLTLINSYIDLLMFESVIYQNIFIFNDKPMYEYKFSSMFFMPHSINNYVLSENHEHNFILNRLKSAEKINFIKSNFITSYHIFQDDEVKLDTNSFLIQNFMTRDKNEINFSPEIHPDTIVEIVDYRNNRTFFSFITDRFERKSKIPDNILLWNLSLEEKKLY